MNNRFEAMVMQSARRPSFENLLKVLRREVPSRATLFEFILNDPLVAKLAGGPCPEGGLRERSAHSMRAFAKAGYDHWIAWSVLVGFDFPRGEQHHAKSISQNEGAVISDRAASRPTPGRTPTPSTTRSSTSWRPTCPRG